MLFSGAHWPSYQFSNLNETAIPIFPIYRSIFDTLYISLRNKLKVVSLIFQWTRETKFPHAVWAAGRGLIALLLPNFDVVDNLWLEPLSWQVSQTHLVCF